MAGTALYMSPEQIRGERITPASDIYTLGVITFEMVTGRRPFSPKTPFQLVAMQQAGVTLLPSALRPALSQGAEAVLLGFEFRSEATLSTGSRLCYSIHQRPLIGICRFKSSVSWRPDEMTQDKLSIAPNILFPRTSNDKEDNSYNAKGSPT